MGRKGVEINPESGKRLSEWLKDIGLTQMELAERVGYTQQYISNVITGKKNMSVQLANEIAAKTYKPGYNVYGEEIGADYVRVQWLLCLDDYKTHEDWADNAENKRDITFNSEWSIMSAAASEHGLKILLKHPFPNPPQYIELIGSQRDSCSFDIQKGERILKSLSVYEFIELTDRLKKYANYLLWELLPEGNNNG